jgi:tRNA(Ile)-lysidine synthase
MKHVGTGNPDLLVRALEAAGIPAGARIVLAVSGGADSMALLRVAARMAPERGWTLLVAHIHHGLRGVDADRDEHFVLQIAADMGIESVARHVDTEGHAKAHALSIEAAARELRYRALGDIVREWGAYCLLTGHTRDDQAETVLLRLAHGAGIHGLGAMRWRHGTIIRPFLHVGRSELRLASSRYVLPYVEDASNDDLRFLRNRVRRYVIPEFDRVQPSVAALIARSAARLQPDSDYIRGEAERALALLGVRHAHDEILVPWGSWAALHPSLRRHTLMALLLTMAGTRGVVAFNHAEMAEDRLLRREGLPIHLPGAISVLVERGCMVFRRCPNVDIPSPSTVSLVPPADIDFGPFLVKARVLRCPPELLRCALAVRGNWHTFLAPEFARQALQVRPRQPGDRIELAGRSGTRKLQDLMVDQKIPRALRTPLPVLSEGARVLWVPLLGTARNALVNDMSGECVHVQVRRSPGTSTEWYNSLP